MKLLLKSLLFILIVFFGKPSFSQNIGIGNAAFIPNASSMLEIQSNGDKGLLIPRVSNAERIAMNPLPMAAQGLLLYQTNTVGTSLEGFYYNTSTTAAPNWVYLSTGNNWSLQGNVAAFTDFIGTTNSMQMAFRTNNVQRMLISPNGFVGIGVPFPFATLHVNGTIRFGNLAGAGNRPVMTDGAGNLFAGAAGAGDWTTTGNAGTFNTNFIGTTDNQSFRIRTNNTQRAVVLNDGKFLVGSTVSLGSYLFQSKANSTNTSAVYGESINATGSYGVYGKGITNGIGVYGLGSTTRPGVLGAVAGTTPKYYSGNSAIAGTGPNVGVFGASTNLTLNAGVLGFGNNLSTGSLNTNGAGVGGLGTFIGVFGQSINTGTNPISAAGGYFVQGSAFAYVGVRQITPNINFKIVGSGSVSTIVRDENEKPVLMFAPEAPEVLFQDYGVGQLVNGFAHIDLDPIFAKNIHVDDTHPLRVYIQPEGDCKGVYVLNKTKNSFEVRELDGGTSSITFSYMVIANRADEADLDTEYTKARFPRGPEALPLKEINAVEGKE